ncbi:MAG: hypothetical protein Q9195_002121 [Heterodermia aff. obscurata]
MEGLPLIQLTAGDRTMYHPMQNATLQRGYLFPVWAPVELALTGFIVSKGGNSLRIYSSIRKYGGSLFGLTSKHQVLVNFAGVDRLMSQSFHTLNAEPFQYTLLTRVFGAIGSSELKKKAKDSWRDLLGPVERMFVNETSVAAAIERGNIPEKAASFVTFSTDKERMRHWELSADIRLVRPSLADNRGVVEANLQSLTRDFGACIAIPLLYGQDFLDRYAQVLDDLWKFDNDLFSLMLIGVPTWAPFKIVKEGLAARSRLGKQMEALYRRIDQYQKKEPVDLGADMSDISNTALDRNKIYRRDDWSFRHRGVSDLALLWGQNANTQPTLFWFLAYVYSTPSLLDELRQEIAPYVTMSQRSPPEIISMDLTKLSRDCPRTKACLFETYRLTIDVVSIRYVERPVTIKDGSLRHELEPGTFVSAPHSTSHRDPSVYANPDEFVPDRFLKTNPETGKMSASYGNLKPWGSGAAICKGRTFAEKEIMAAGAAIISLWDIGPAGGSWKLPSMVPGTGVKKPAADMRVLISRRVLN